MFGAPIRLARIVADGDDVRRFLRTQPMRSITAAAPNPPAAQMPRTAAVMERHRAVAEGQPRPTFADIRALRSADLASQRAVSQELNDIVSCMALLVDSPVTRVIGNFFLRVLGPSYPVRVFRDEDAARAWLRTQPGGG